MGSTVRVWSQPGPGREAGTEAPSPLAGTLAGKPSPRPPREQPPRGRGQFRAHLSSCPEAPLSAKLHGRSGLGPEQCSSCRCARQSSERTRQHIQPSGSPLPAGPSPEVSAKRPASVPPLLTVPLRHLPGLPHPLPALPSGCGSGVWPINVSSDPGGSPGLGGREGGLWGTSSCGL